MSIEAIVATSAGIAAAATPTPTPERLFTLEQVQAAGNFSRSTLYRLRHGGGLKTITIAGLVRVRERDWLAWLDKNATTAIEGGAE